MRSVVRMLSAAVLALLLSGCWASPGFGPDRQSFNPFEKALTTTTVGRLRESFRAVLADGAGAPVATPAGAYVRSGVTIRAFDPATGVARWTATLPEPDAYEATISDPHVLGDGSQVLASVASTDGFHPIRLVTLSASTGAMQRSPFEGELQSLRGTRAASVYRTDPREQDLTFVGVRDVRGGSPWGGLAPGATGGTASLGGDRLYVASGQQVLAYDPATPCPPFAGLGNVQVCSTEWIRPLGAAVTPAVIGEHATVYVATAAGTVVALDAATGAERWRASVGAAITDAPALADGVLYVGSADGRLSAIPADGCGSSTCPVRWRSAAGSAVASQPAVAGGVVYIGSTDGTVRAFAAGGCRAFICPSLWSADAGSSVDGGVAVDNGHLFAGTHGALVGYRLGPS